MNKPLRIGLLIDAYDVPAWLEKMLEIINDAEYATVELVVKNKVPVPQRSFLQKLKANLPVIFFRIYQVAERRLFRLHPDAFAVKDIAPLLKNVPLIEVTPVQKKFSDYLPKEDIEKIKGHDIDVFLRLGFRILRGDALKIARYGVWSLHHGDNLENRGGPPGVWEVLMGWHKTGSVLQILSEDLDGGDVLYRSWTVTDKTALDRNANTYYWKTLAFIPRQLKRLHQSGAATFFEEIQQQNQHPSFYSNRLFKTPRNAAFSLLIIKHWANIFAKGIEKIFYKNQWALLYSINKENRIAGSVFRFKKLRPPKDRFWADPCIVNDNGKYFLFFEELIFAEKNAHIAVVEIDPETGDVSKPEIVLKTDYHLSYPFVFKNNGNWYMIPETMANKTIELWKSVSFPYKWEFEMNVMENVLAVDSTILFKDDKYWLFTNIAEHEGACVSDELFIFSSPTLLSTNWQPHAANPVISDVARARPAGRFFEWNGNLYRPSQDCSVGYGYAININMVKELSEEKYAEEKVSSIVPNWDKKVKFTHTFSYEGQVTVIDGNFKRSRFI